MKKKIVSILLCATMVAAMAVGCGSKDGGSDSKSESGDSKDKKYKVGITIQSLSNAYWAGVMGKLEEQLKDKGWDYTLIDCEDNSATQVSQIENFITSGCDLIMVHPSDAEAVENICKEALDADIKVMCWDDPMENTTANWVLDNTELGKEIGKTAAEFINDKFTADDKAQVTVIGYPSTKVLKERADGIKEGLKEGDQVISDLGSLEEGMQAEAASMLITLKETYSALKRIGVEDKKKMVILGDGPVALAFLSCAKLMGIQEIYVLGNHRDKLENWEQQVHFLTKTKKKRKKLLICLTESPISV